MNDEPHYTPNEPLPVSPATPPQPEPESDRSSVPNFSQLCVALLLLIAVLGSPLVYTFFTTPHTPAREPYTLQYPEEKALPAQPYAGVTLEAHAAFVWDVAAQQALYSKNAHAQLPLASITKLMTALVARDVYGEGDRVAITAAAIAQEGEDGLRDGERWHADDLLDYMLVASSNDGAYALSASIAAAGTGEDSVSVFIDMMNTKAKDLGLDQTYFTNPTGLDVSVDESGAYGSARDVAFLMEHILTEAPDLLHSTTESALTTHDLMGGEHHATNTNPMIALVPNALGSKTGYTDLAGGNLVIAFDIGLNHPIIISVLGSTREGRFSDVATLLRRTQDAFTPTTP